MEIFMLSCLIISVVLIIYMFIISHLKIKESTRDFLFDLGDCLLLVFGISSSFILVMLMFK